MKRTQYNYLKTWLTSLDRRPLIIRGARQVGKTWLVRHFAEQSGKRLIELNFEKNPEHASLFASNDPQQILLNLSALTLQPIEPQESLLFLDEIQAIPELLSKLRWFAEDLPALSVIAAGSLLEFVLAEHIFSMPVGRITYLYLEPLSFEEYLLAHQQEGLLNYLVSFDGSTDIPIAIHEKLTLLFKEYCLVGGLPRAVSSWVAERSLSRVYQIHHDLLGTYRDDFAKYRGRIAIERLEEIFMTTPKMLGRKFVFSHVNREVQSAAVKQGLDLLEKARICHRVRSTSANGIPLGAEVRARYFKEIFLDVGLCATLLGLNLNQLNAIDDITLINQGGMAEQVVGQLLRTIEPPYVQPSLYCWEREEPRSNAEVDYIIQHGCNIIPIEVKAGSTGSLKSLHYFMHVKGLKQAVRINADHPSVVVVDTKIHTGEVVKYQLLSFPFYLIGQLHRLLDRV
ncbi:MAG: ATP-binding protein [Legionella sp.]|nr:ATP-binding protein [Legionella sp.]